MSDFVVPDSIAHAGVKGMRWGARQPETRGGTPQGTRTKAEVNTNPKKAMSTRVAVATGKTVFAGTAFTASALAKVGGKSIEKLLDPQTAMDVASLAKSTYLVTKAVTKIAAFPVKKLADR